jgi:hypothetical protein
LFRLTTIFKTIFDKCFLLSLPRQKAFLRYPRAELDLSRTFADTRFDCLQHSWAAAMASISSGSVRGSCRLLQSTSASLDSALAMNIAQIAISALVNKVQP